MNLPSGDAHPTSPVKPPRSVYAAKLREFPGIAFAEEAAFQHRGRWSEFFRNRIGPGFDGQIVFEVGCFDASYLSRLAVKFPRIGFVGLDWKCKAIYDGARRVAESRLDNVALLRGRAQEIRRIFGDAEVNEIWVFHPDPCAGPGELKNRLMAEPFLLDAHAVLRNETSRLMLKTDHPGYYQWVLGLFSLPQPEWLREARVGVVRPGEGKPRVRIRDLMAEHEIPWPLESLRRRFKVLTQSGDFWNDPVALRDTEGRCFAGEMTSFENRFVKKRLPIYFLEIAPVPSPSGTAGGGA